MREFVTTLIAGVVIIAAVVGILFAISVYGAFWRSECERIYDIHNDFKCGLFIGNHYR